jgi:hypothetical protein
LTFVALGAIAGSGSGCSAQGPGDRCTFFPNSADADINGSSECQDGLRCYPRSDFPASSGGYDRCCPLSLALATNVAACYVPNNVGVSQDSGAPDAPSDAPTDAPRADGPVTDAPLDGPTGDSKPGDAPSSDAPADGKTGSDGAGSDP